MREEYTIWWKVFLGNLEAVRVVSATPRTVTILGDDGRERRRNLSGPSRFFPTRKEAVDHILKEARDRVDLAKDQLERAQRHLDKMRAVHEPPGAE
jgi:hypothetical protein